MSTWTIAQRSTGGTSAWSGRWWIPLSLLWIGVDYAEEHCACLTPAKIWVSTALCAMMRAVQAMHLYAKCSEACICLDGSVVTTSNDGAFSGRFFPSDLKSVKFLQDFVCAGSFWTPWTNDGSGTASRHKVQGVELIRTETNTSPKLIRTVLVKLANTKPTALSPLGRLRVNT